MFVGTSSCMEPPLYETKQCDMEQRVCSLSQPIAHIEPPSNVACQPPCVWLKTPWLLHSHCGHCIDVVLYHGELPSSSPRAVFSITWSLFLISCAAVVYIASFARIVANYHIASAVYDHGMGLPLVWLDLTLLFELWFHILVGFSIYSANTPSHMVLLGYHNPIVNLLFLFY